MGIPGLISVLGQGERVSLSSFAVHFLQDKKRPIRIAIDISIWLFQIQASKGGLNPELRTLLFRLIRLTSLPVHPLFVYDGKDRPRLKRGKVVRGSNGTILERQSQKLLGAFNLPWHRAPGEAEAECSLLQRAGIVDAVMTDDIDAVMFGSEVTLLNFSKEMRGSGAATHVSVYRTRRSADGRPPNVDMDRQAMILFALLSGGDYLPAGVPKCGTKLAAEIVAAGYGKQLMNIFRSNGEDQEEQLAEWRQQLEEELHTNASGFFKTKHKAITIPTTFPDKQVLLAYAIPVVSNTAEVRALREKISWEHAIDPEKVKAFSQEILGWDPASGAVTLTNLLSLPLLTQRMLLQLPLLALLDGDSSTNILAVCSEKKYNDSSGYDEVRVEFIPTQVVGFVIDESAVAEVAKKHASTILNDDDSSDFVDSEGPSSLKEAQSSRTSYDVNQRKRAWIPEAVAKVGMPDILQAYRALQAEKVEAQRRAAEEKAKRIEARKAKQNAKGVIDPSMKEGSILKYTRVVKPGVSLSQKPTPPKRAPLPAEKRNTTAPSPWESFSGSSVFESTQTLPPESPAAVEKHQRGSKEPTANLRNTRSHRQERSLADEPHTSDLEAEFDLDYNYEGLRREVEARDATLTRNQKGAHRARPQRRKPSARRQAKADCQAENGSGGISQPASGSSPLPLHHARKGPTHVANASRQHAPDVSDEDIVASMRNLAVSSRTQSSRIDADDVVVKQLLKLSIARTTEPVRRCAGKRDQHILPATRGNIASSSRCKGPNLITLTTCGGAKIGASGVQVAQHAVIAISSDSEDSDGQERGGKVTAACDQSTTAGGKGQATSPDLEKTQRLPTHRLLGKVRAPAGKSETAPGTDLRHGQQRSADRTGDGLIIETFGGFWRYRSVRESKAGVAADSRQGKTDPISNWQSETQIWRGAVECVDLT